MGKDDSVSLEASIAARRAAIAAVQTRIENGVSAKAVVAQ